MNRYHKMKEYVFALLEEKSHGYYKKNSYSHMFQVETICVFLAKHRGLDPELCAIIGMMHDLSVPLDMNTFQHAARSADLAKKLFEETALFSDEEQEIMVSAIRNHSHKERVDDGYSELLKDADVISHDFEGDALKDAELDRLMRLDEYHYHF